MLLRTAFGSALLVVAAFGHDPGLASAQQAQRDPLLVMVSLSPVRPMLRSAFDALRVTVKQSHEAHARPFPYDVMTDDDEGTYVFVTYGLRDLADYERWVTATDAAAPPPPSAPQPPAALGGTRWFMLEQPTWSYTPANPRVRREDAAFVHWDVYYGRETPLRWGLEGAEGRAAGFLPNPEHFAAWVALHRARGITDGFRVYTAYANTHPRGPAVIIETWARSAEDYYGRLVSTQRMLGAEGFDLQLAWLANSRGMERHDFHVRPDLSYRR
jgi:hypothetical protein